MSSSVDRRVAGRARTDAPVERRIEEANAGKMCLSCELRFRPLMYLPRRRACNWAEMESNAERMFRHQFGRWNDDDDQMQGTEFGISGPGPNAPSSHMHSLKAGSTLPTLQVG